MSPFPPVSAKPSIVSRELPSTGKSNVVPLTTLISVGCGGWLAVASPGNRSAAATSSAPAIFIIQPCVRRRVPASRRPICCAEVATRRASAARVNPRMRRSSSIRLCGGGVSSAMVSDLCPHKTTMVIVTPIGDV